LADAFEVTQFHQKKGRRRGERATVDGGVQAAVCLCGEAVLFSRGALHFLVPEVEITPKSPAVAPRRAHRRTPSQIAAGRMDQGVTEGQRRVLREAPDVWYPLRKKGAREGAPGAAQGGSRARGAST